MEQDTPTKRRNPHKGGRKALPVDQQRIEKIEIRLTTSEKASWRDRAADHGMTVSDWLRSLTVVVGEAPSPALAGPKRVPLADHQVLSELNRVGVNLNQIARALNCGDERTVNAGLNDTLAELNDLLSVVSARL